MIILVSYCMVIVTGATPNCKVFTLGVQHILFVKEGRQTLEKKAREIGTFIIMGGKDLHVLEFGSRPWR